MSNEQTKKNSKVYIVYILILYITATNQKKKQDSLTSCTQFAVNKVYSMYILINLMLDLDGRLSLIYCVF